MEGNLVALRALEPSDVERLYKWENDPDVWTVSNLVCPYSKHTLRQFVETSMQDLYAAKQLRLMIDERATRATVGVIDIFDFDPLHRRAGIGILIEKSRRQQGFAEESLALVKAYLFDFLHLNQIYCDIITDNVASLKLFQNAGFTICGTKKSWVLTKNQYKDVHILQCLNA